MNEHDEDRWTFRAGRAWRERRFIGFVVKSILALFTTLVFGIIYLAATVLAFAVPFQAVRECIVWLKTAEWDHYDWVDYLGYDEALRLTSSDAKGLNVIMAWVLDSWVSVPISAVSLVVLMAFFSYFESH